MIAVTFVLLWLLLVCLGLRLAEAGGMALRIDLDVLEAEKAAEKEIAWAQRLYGKGAIAGWGGEKYVLQELQKDVLNR